MPVCGERAVLIITASMEGTSTSVARQRISLCCDREQGHVGPHGDARCSEQWDAEPGTVKTLLKHEDEFKGPELSQLARKQEEGEEP